MSDDRPAFKTWYCEAIGKVRAASTPGGVALTIEEAEALRDELGEAIETAREAEQ